MFLQSDCGETSIYIMCFDETASWVQLELARRKPASVEGLRRRLSLVLLRTREGA